MNAGRLEHFTNAIIKHLRLAPGDQFHWQIGDKTYLCEIKEADLDLEGEYSATAKVIKEITPELEEKGTAVKPGIKL